MNGTERSQVGASLSNAQGSNAQVSDKARRCIAACRDCENACLETIYSICLPEGGFHAQTEQVRLLQDCAEACQVSANFLLRSSPSSGYFCSVAARLCDRCAAACRRLGGLEQCADACSRCAALCHQMGKVPPEGL